MKKTALASAMALSMGTGIAQAGAFPMTDALFTMYSSAGGTIGSPDNTVTGSIDNQAGFLGGTGGTFTVASTTTFFGSLWTAHDGVTFGPGTYTIDTIEGGVYTGIVVGAGQVGGHILFDWGVNTNIDVVMVWDVCTSCGAYTSTDWDGDGIRGAGMLDGAFKGSSANFDFTAPVPIPAAAWLFGSGLLGLVGIARRRKSTS